MGDDHQFDGVGDHLPADHRHLHSLMAGGKPVANGDGWKLQGGSSGFGNAQLDRLAK